MCDIREFTGKDSDGIATIRAHPTQLPGPKCTFLKTAHFKTNKRLTEGISNPGGVEKRPLDQGSHSIHPGCLLSALSHHHWPSCPASFPPGINHRLSFQGNSKAVVH